VIQTCQNNVKVIFPRGQADNYGKQNGVRIPRQILISRGYSGPIRHHFDDNRILVAKHDRRFSFHTLIFVTMSFYIVIYLLYFLYIHILNLFHYFSFLLRNTIYVNGTAK